MPARGSISQVDRPLQKIIYAEDEPGIQAIARVCLERVGGFTLCICDSGVQLLEECAAFGPDLILLDVMMPDLDGPQTLARLRQDSETRDIPVLFITAKSQKAEIEQLMGLGAIGVLQKPFDPMTLADQIRQAWTRHHHGPD